MQLRVLVKPNIISFSVTDETTFRDLKAQIERDLDNLQVECFHIGELYFSLLSRVTEATEGSQNLVLVARLKPKKASAEPRSLLAVSNERENLAPPQAQETSTSPSVLVESIDREKLVFPHIQKTRKSRICWYCHHTMRGHSQNPNGAKSCKDCATGECTFCSSFFTCKNSTFQKFHKKNDGVLTAEEMKILIATRSSSARKRQKTDKPQQ